MAQSAPRGMALAGADIGAIGAGAEVFGRVAADNCVAALAAARRATPGRGGV